MQRVVTHPVVGVTIVVVEPPGGTAARPFHVAMLNPKGHANRKAMEAFNTCLAKHVTLDGGANIVPAGGLLGTSTRPALNLLLLLRILGASARGGC